jgi:hypothetical protein
LKFVNELVTVELQLRENGTVLPLAFLWQGRRLQIESWGRENTSTHGGRTVRCYLVQTAGGETWELCQDREKAQWFITRHWAGRSKLA